VESGRYSAANASRRDRDAAAAAASVERKNVRRCMEPRGCIEERFCGCIHARAVKGRESRLSFLLTV
jgi:hypothetical protein